MPPPRRPDLSIPFVRPEEPYRQSSGRWAGCVALVAIAAAYHAALFVIFRSLCR